VGQEREPERRLPELPDEVPGVVARPRARSVGEPPLEPRQPRLLTVVRRRDLRQRYDVPLDIRTNVSDDRTSLLV
jgi:hypothetical protein